MSRKQEDMDAASPFEPCSIERSYEPERENPDGIPQFYGKTDTGWHSRRACGSAVRSDGNPNARAQAKFAVPAGRQRENPGLVRATTRLQYAKPHFLVSGMVYNNPLPRPCAHYDL